MFAKQGTEYCIDDHSKRGRCCGERESRGQWFLEAASDVLQSIKIFVDLAITKKQNFPVSN